MKGWLENLQRKYGNVLNRRILIMGIVGIGLLLIGNLFEDTTENNKNEKKVLTESMKKMPIENNQTIEDEKKYLEDKFAEMLSRVKGAGNVSVHITFDGSSTKEYDKNLVKEKKNIQEKESNGIARTTTEIKENEQIVMQKTSGAEQPVLIKEVHPVIQGVMIVADGAADSLIKAELTKAAAVGLGISSYKITVLPQRK